MFAQLVVITPAILTVSARIPSQIQPRAFTGPACKPDFQWTDNESNVSPCTLAATVIGSCEGPTWNIPPLKTGFHYDPPVGINATQCSCSWAAYNLISACTVCQGFEESVSTWPFYSTNCIGQTSDKYFPSTQALPDGTGIPFYAGTDPSTWNDQRFNIEQARTIHDQGHSDLVQSLSQNQSSSPVGAIVGGVIGGLAVIALAGVIAFYMYRKKKKQTESLVTHVGTDGSKHGRTVSDLSQTSVFGPFRYRQTERSLATSPSSEPPLSPTTGTMHTHTASVNSISYFGSVSHSVTPFGTSLSPPPPNASVISPMSQSPSPPPNNQLTRENIIVPFTLPSSDTTSTGLNVNLDAKRADGAMIPTYDSPDSLPAHVVSGNSLSVNTPTKSRVNPPVYSAIDEASIAPSQTHQKTGSSDTNFSADSKTGDVMSVVQRRGAGGGSISAIDDMIGQMGFSGPESVSAGGTLSTGQSGQFRGPRPFRPVLGNPDP